MKHGFRIISCILLLCILLSSMTSCLTYVRIMDMAYDGTLDGGSEQDVPSLDYPHLEYTLTDDDEAAFLSVLADCEAISLSGGDPETIDEAWDMVYDQYYHISTQAQIAYILYCCDLTDETLSGNYLYASEMQANVYDAYIVVCQKLDQSDSSYREHFFSDWTEAELKEMRLYSDRVTELHRKNDQILVDYRDLDVTEEGEKVSDLYADLVANNNEIAKKLGYKNYYDYASELIYMRDYGKDERALLRTYVKEYLVPLCAAVWDQFDAAMNELSAKDYNFVIDFMDEDYDELSGDYLQSYLNSFEGSSKAAMEGMLEEGNSIFTDSSNALEGAFTATLSEYEKPVCYFGPSYQDILTVVHEMGHYYGAQYTEDEDLVMDLAEVQSQGNEWLLLTFLQEELDEDVYEAVVSYQLYMMLTTIVVSTVVDEFEEYIYTVSARNPLTVIDYDRAMDSICASYGGTEFFEEYITDMQMYWKYVVIESPVYYISYAVSGVAALALYEEATYDYARAQQTYRKLLENVNPEKEFLGNLVDAGLRTPFDERLYRDIQRLAS